MLTPDSRDLLGVVLPSQCREIQDVFLRPLLCRGCPSMSQVTETPQNYTEVVSP